MNMYNNNILSVKSLFCILCIVCETPLDVLYIMRFGDDVARNEVDEVSLNFILQNYHTNDQIDKWPY